MNPKISVIIPTYNAGKTIERCLQSIIQQSYNDFEVWFVDGGSTDTTLTTIERYTAGRNYIRYLSEPDKGIYDAMNKGIKLCTGDWIYFMGSDDTFYNSQVLSLISNETAKTHTGIIYGNVIMRGQNQWNLDNVVFNGKYDLEKIVNINICHQAIFYHKDIFDHLGNYNLSYVTSADHDFNMRCFAATSFHYVDTIIANFFVGGHSTFTTDEKFNQDRGALLMRYFKGRIFTRTFINSRLYLQQASFTGHPDLNWRQRLICLMAYLKLKTMSYYVSGAK